MKVTGKKAQDILLKSSYVPMEYDLPRVTAIVAQHAVNHYVHPDAQVLVDYRLTAFMSAMEKVPDVCIGADAYAEKYRAIKDYIITAADKSLEQAHEHIMKVLKESRKSAADFGRSLALQQSISHLPGSHSGARVAFSGGPSAFGFDKGSGDVPKQGVCCHFPSGKCTSGAKCRFKHEMPQQPAQAFQGKCSFLNSLDM